MNAIKEYKFYYIKSSLSKLSPEDGLLVEKAVEATKSSYAPYSNYNVGAALLLETGTIIQGSNQENSSYPCGICAERSALYNAQSNYPNNIVKAIAVCATQNGILTPDHCSPCGLCRQAIAEVERKQQNNIRIIMVSAESVLIFESISQLLPFCF